MPLHELVYIGAAWCSTCKTIKPALVELCKKFSVSIILKDYDNDLDDDEQAAVTKVPTVRIIVDGRQVAEFNIRQIAQTEDWFLENIKMSATEDF
jgi:thiol-disulfide isomerase/thioredoxin